MRRILLSVLSVFAVLLAPIGTPAYADATITQGRLSLTTDQTRVQPGTVVTLSGLLEGYNGTDWAPLAGETVTLEMLSQVNGWISFRTLTTDAAGRYETTVAVQHNTEFIDQSSSFMAHWAGPADSAEGTYSPQASVAVPYPVTIPVSKFSYDAYGNLTIAGRVSSQNFETGLTLTAEFSPTGTGRWTAVKTIDGVRPYADYGFLISYPQSGYWRIHSAADANHWEGYSPVQRAWRWATKMTGFKVGPTKIRYGGSITISGTLLGYHNGAFRGLGKQQIYIDYRIKGQSTSYWLAKVRTDTKGRFSFVARHIGRSARWTVDFHGATGYFACWPGRWVLVNVK